MNLNDKVIQEANYEGESFLGETGRWEWSKYILWDHQTPGLGVRISPNNAKVFVHTQLVGTEKNTVTLGKVGEITLELARARAAALSATSGTQSAEDVMPLRVADPTESISSEEHPTAQSPSPHSPPLARPSGRRQAASPRSGSKNRRRHPRLRVVMVVAKSTAGRAEIMDLSRTGMAIEAQRSFPVGEVHGFLLSNRSHQLEVDGRIQWCRSSSLSSAATEASGRIFQIGVAFTKIHTKEPPGIFAGLRTDGDQSGLDFFVEPERPVEPGDTKPLITIVTPRNGSTVYSSPVTVLGIVQGPLSNVPIEVEGVEARIDGEWFEAEIPLSPGNNQISAVTPSENSALYRSPSIVVTFDPTENE